MLALLRPEKTFVVPRVLRQHLMTILWAGHVRQELDRARKGSMQG